MYMDEPPLHGSDPEASIAVPEQSIRIDIAVLEHSFGLIAPRIGYDSSLSPASCMSPAPCTAINSRPSSALLRPMSSVGVGYRLGGPGFIRQSPDCAAAQRLPELSSYKAQTALPKVPSSP